MSRHWNPDREFADRARRQHVLDRELADRIAAEELARARRRGWPAGATVGLMMVAGSCLALGLALYQFAGPRDVVEKEVARR